MKLFNYIYYCIYRYVLKAPDRVAADAWPPVFLGWTLWIHALMLYWLAFLIAPGKVPALPNKIICVGVMIFLIAVFSWYYVLRENGARVIRSFEQRQNQGNYARLGALMWYESLLVLFMVVGVLALSQRLTGWPPPL